MVRPTAIILLLGLLFTSFEADAAEVHSDHEANDNEGQWITLDRGVEFQPNELEASSNPSLRLAQHRFLSSANKSPFAAQDEYYPAYAQAWRMLGFFVDCEDSAEEGSRDHRELNGDKTATCQRYLMWASYVDLNYVGGGIGEYKFWDAETSSWDATTCEQHGGDRCAKMDCHDPSTSTWTLLGIYKEAFYASEWFEQLFKHAGYCNWSNDVYEFMKDRYDDWPEGCEDTDATDENGNSLYLDLKPSAGGNLTLALYTDDICKTEYMGNYVTVEDAAGDEFVTGSNLELFNDAMEYYKYCNPCRAANRKTSDENERGGKVRALGQGYDDDQEDPNDGYWKCSDAAGYTNVNQCMKFRTHTTFRVASMFDLQTATMQGGIVEVAVGQHSYGAAWNPKQADATEESSSVMQAAAVISRAVPNTGRILIITGSIFLVCGFAALVAAIRWVRQRRQRFLQVHLTEPLM
ncbi:hypothetical protein MPSEU_000850600 [Mayamaea pseudoterrestris]|nr:hypothetical protein MPSEU_000850600 [Mayamaea pseudoterrestris]